MTFGITARAFRFYEDGTEAGSTAIAAENANITRFAASDSNLLLRYGVQESGSASTSGNTTDDYQLQVSKNGGAFANVTTASTNVKGFNSASLTDAGATTSRLSAGSGSFVAGAISEDGLLDNWQLTANNYSDFLYTITVVAADVADGDTLDFKVLRNGSNFNTYSVTPRITISKNTNGTLSKTLDAATTTSTAGTVDVQGAAATTLAAATLSSAGTVEVKGTTAYTLAAVALTAAGTVANSEASGVLAVTLGDTLSAAAGTVDIAGIGAVVLAVISTAGAGAVAVSGASLLQLTDTTASSAGAVAVDGTGALAVSAASLSSAGAVAVAGVVSSLLDAAALVAAGVVGEPPNEGVLASTLDAFSLAGVGVLPVAGALASAIDGIVLSASGAVDVLGAASSTLDAVVAAAAGYTETLGALTVTLEDIVTVPAGVGGSAIIALASMRLQARGAVVTTEGSHLTLTLDSATVGQYVDVPVLVLSVES